MSGDAWVVVVVALTVLPALAAVWVFRRIDRFPSTVRRPLHILKWGLTALAVYLVIIGGPQELLAGRLNLVSGLFVCLVWLAVRSAWIWFNGNPATLDHHG